MIQVLLHLYSRLLRRSSAILVSISKMEVRDKLFRDLGPFSRIFNSTGKIFRQSSSGPSLPTFDAVDKIFRDLGTSLSLSDARQKRFSDSRPFPCLFQSTDNIFLHSGPC